MTAGSDASLVQSLAPPRPLARWLQGRVDLAGPLVVERLTVGRSNEVFRIADGTSTWLLRRPPRVASAQRVRTLEREHRLLKALHGSGVPHAAEVAFCDDETVLGAPFLILEWVDGFAPRLPLPAQLDADTDRRRSMCFALVDALSEVAQLDWRRRGLAGFGRPDGFLERQVTRWLAHLEQHRTRPLPYVDALSRWLTEHRPVQQAHALMHGDYTWTNVMYSNSDPTRVAAIVDWEQATIGDPMLDIGYLTGLWYEPGEDAGGRDPAGLFCQLPGNPTRDELVERFARATGLDPAHIAYYQTLAMFKLACILEVTWARYVAGGSDDPEHARFGPRVPALLHRAALFAKLT